MSSDNRTIAQTIGPSNESAEYYSIVLGREADSRRESGYENSISTCGEVLP